MKNKILKLSNWDNYTIHLQPSLFSKDLLKFNLNKFWSDIVETKLSENQHMLFLFRLQWSDNQFVTIGNLQKLNNDDKDYIFDYLSEEIKNKGDYYLENSVISIVFSYGIRDGRTLEKTINNKIQFHNYQHHKLPVTMNPLEYGKLVRRFDNIYNVQINDKNDVFITQFEDKNEIEFYRSGTLVYKWIDKWINENTFSRLLGKKEFIFKDNELFLLKVDKPAKFITKLNLSNEIQNKFITFDIETYIKNGIHIPYCICWYDGENYYSYYLSDFNNSLDMIIQAIKDIMIKKYDNYKIYIHNLSNFDAIFLLKILAGMGFCKPIIHHDNIISIQFNFNGYTVTFRDSQQILTASLRKLAKSFGVDTQKSIFPYSFVNENNLDYIGPIPDFKYFDGISSLDYNCYIENYNIWNLREEAIKYCEIDCISLYQIIIKFSNMIFDLFNINIHKYPTLSSIAFAIFRIHFLRKNEISQSYGQTAKEIRHGYTGGAVDMYIPRPPKGSKIFCYDVNSLYPYVMDQFDMPTGKPVHFYGDIRKIDPNAFGFFYCKIVAPDNLKHPILQTHVKVNKGTRTIAPLGQWEDMIFSAEMDNAINYGYKFEILWGYKFKPKNIFKGYVGILYKLRTQYPKTNPLNLIAKLLLNSLYGRFGMLDSFANITIFNTFDEFKLWFKDHNEDVIQFEELGNKVMVQHRSKLLDEYTDEHGNLETHNISIGIAAAVTAYARIHMSQFKNNPNFNLYYSDTDSIYIDKPLPDEFISSTILGKMKLEYICKNAIFLAPKVYYLETEDGKVIYKVKGLKHEVDLTLKDFESLLCKDNVLQKFQTKWVKSLSEGHVSLLEQLYILKVTDSKRKLVYENNKYINTNPYFIDDKKEIVELI